MSALACLEPVALFHSFWCSSVSQLLISSVTNLLEAPTTGSGPVKFSLAASFSASEHSHTSSYEFGCFF